MGTVGERIRSRRRELGWTQDELARRAGISKSFLSDLENGRRSVSADNLFDIARTLSLSMDFLMTGTSATPDSNATPEPSPPQEVVIPASLSAFANEASLSFRQTMALLAMQRQIIAHRSNTKNHDVDAVDWRRFYESVKAFL